MTILSEFPTAALRGLARLTFEQPLSLKSTKHSLKGTFQILYTALFDIAGGFLSLYLAAALLASNFCSRYWAATPFIHLPSAFLCRITGKIAGSLNILSK